MLRFMQLVGVGKLLSSIQWLEWPHAISSTTERKGGFPFQETPRYFSSCFSCRSWRTLSFNIYLGILIVNTFHSSMPPGFKLNSSIGLGAICVCDFTWSSEFEKHDLILCRWFESHSSILLFGISKQLFRCNFYCAHAPVMVLTRAIKDLQ